MTLYGALSFPPPPPHPPRVGESEAVSFTFSTAALPGGPGGGQPAASVRTRSPRCGTGREHPVSHRGFPRARQEPWHPGACSVTAITSLRVHCQSSARRFLLVSFGKRGRVPSAPENLNERAVWIQNMLLVLHIGIHAGDACGPHPRPPPQPPAYEQVGEETF